MFDLSLSVVGNAKRMPTVMVLSVVLFSMNIDAKESIKILSERYNSLLTSVKGIIGECGNIKKGVISTSARYKNIEKKNSNGTKVSTSEFSHYYSKLQSAKLICGCMQSMVISDMDINIDTLILLINEAYSNEGVSSCDFSFSLKEDEMYALREVAIRKAFDEAVHKAELFSIMNKSAGKFKLKDVNMNSSVSSRNSKMKAGIDGSVFDNLDFGAVENTGLVFLRDNIDVREVSVSQTISFTFEIGE